MRATIELTLGQRREIAYNAFLSSLDPREVSAYCAANRLVDGTQVSLELHLHDMFRDCKIDEDTIGAEILVLLGEI